MKNLQQITSEHINSLRKNEFVIDVEEIQKIGMSAANRIKARLENDPAIMDLSEFFTKSVMQTSFLPPGFRDQAIRNAIINCIMEWEQINREFEDQLKPLP